MSSIEKHFSGEPRRIALEAGAQSAWISRELKQLGREVVVANARELKWITSSDTKNDPGDARKLALLARADVRLLAPVEHCTAEQQAELAVIRARDAILRARTLLINTARGMAKGFGVRLPPSITGKFGQVAARYPEVKLLESVPGVGTLTAVTFRLTLGRAERFAHSRDVAGFLGLRPKLASSHAPLGSPRMRMEAWVESGTKIFVDSGRRLMEAY